MTRFQAPKGVAEYLPPQSATFLAVREALIAPARRAGYAFAELPIFEDTALFARGLGASTDVVSKEMYTFEDRGGRSISLRPDGTASTIRAVIEHGLDRGGLPVKLWYSGPFFRAERPQAGRYRQFTQVGIEAIGSDDPILDAEVVALAAAAFADLGITDFTLNLTSLGDATCRPAYRSLLQEFLAALDLDESTRARAAINPLRVLDDKRDEVRRQVADAPLMLDHLCEACRIHFESVRGHLDRLGVAYVINPQLVRGLDYYTRTTFEFVHHGLGAQSGIGGGGRYDGLMEELGGQSLSGIGWALGVDRTLLALEAEGRTASVDGLLAFLVPIGGPARDLALDLAMTLRQAGISCDLAFGDRGLKGAMKAADRSGARFAIVLGESELAAGSVTVKDLRTGEQESIARDALVEQLMMRQEKQK
jgi:histidyl-tRNA synthetase